MTYQSCKRQSSRQLSLWRRDGVQPDSDQNEQQQQQPGNHSSDNAEIARCLTPFSHHGENTLLHGQGRPNFAQYKSLLYACKIIVIILNIKLKICRHVVEMIMQ